MKMTNTNKEILDLVICNDYDDYSQIDQVSEMTFSFLTKEIDHYSEMFTAVLCRDYLNDCVSASLRKDGVVPEVYGFELEERICTDKVLLSVVGISEDRVSKVIPVIRSIESLFKGSIIPLEIHATNTDKFIVIGDKAWLKSQLIFSLLSFTLRVASHTSFNIEDTPNIHSFFKKAEEEVFGEDKNHLELLNKMDVVFFLENIDEIIGHAPMSGQRDEYYPESGEISETTIYNLHDNTGCITLANRFCGTYLSMSKDNMLELPSTYIFESVGGYWLLNLFKLKCPGVFKNICVHEVYKVEGVTYYYKKVGLIPSLISKVGTYSLIKTSTLLPDKDLKNTSLFQNYV